MKAGYRLKTPSEISVEKHLNELFSQKGEIMAEQIERKEEINDN